MIEINDLHQSYGDDPVLQGVNLHVAAGASYGLLGPNGAGKSTLLHLMLGFLRPKRGTIRLLGSSNLEQVRQSVGYIPERQRYHTHYTAREYLRFLGAFSGLHGGELHDRVDHELLTAGLADVANRRLGTFSKGMLQRFGVAQALLGDPDLLLIDEPTSGLDPSGRRALLDLLKQVRKRGHTILLCTHHLYEVEYICDRVGVLVGGRITAEAEVQTLRGVATSLSIQTTTMPEQLQKQLTALGPQITYDSESILIGANSPELQATVMRTLLEANILIVQLEPLERPLARFYHQAVQGLTPAAAAAAPKPLAVPYIPPVPWTNPHPVSAQPQSERGTGDTLLNQLLGREEGGAEGEKNQGTEEQRNGGTEEQRNGGTEEQRNGG
ncbi:ABC transporter ATP-binding protein, partial [Candidatus Viridilinea mediisalina]|uniref:ABC transporter ATP-binding protein n=1 Tax=Candidatus Viridilinea mediisalina TaxID=2024553 RepID=UPI00105575F3